MLECVVIRSFPISKHDLKAPTAIENSFVAQPRIREVASNLFSKPGSHIFWS